MSMKRYSTDSCCVQYFQPNQQYKYVPECLPEYETGVNIKTLHLKHICPHDIPNHFFEPWQQQSWTNTDLEHYTSDWQMSHTNDNHSVARTSAGASKLAVAFGTLQDATRRKLLKKGGGTTFPAWTNSQDPRYYDYRRAVRRRNYNYQGGAGRS